jgi:hypothetical protein
MVDILHEVILARSFLCLDYFFKLSFLIRLVLKESNVADLSFLGRGKPLVFVVEVRYSDPVSRSLGLGCRYLVVQLHIGQSISILVLRRNALPLGTSHLLVGCDPSFNFQIFVDVKVISVIVPVVIRVLGVQVELKPLLNVASD